MAKISEPKNDTPKNSDDTVKQFIDDCFEALSAGTGKHTQWYRDSRHGVYCILDE